MAVHYPAESLSLLRVHLEMMFQSVRPIERVVGARLDGSGGKADDPPVPGFRVFDTVDVLVTGPAFLTVEWVSGATADLIADAVLATILQIHAAPASIEALHQLQEHDAEHPAHAPSALAGKPAAATDAAPLVAAIKREPVVGDVGSAVDVGGEVKAEGDLLPGKRTDGDDVTDTKKPRPELGTAAAAVDAAVDAAAAAYAAKREEILRRSLLEGVRQHFSEAALDASGDAIAVAADGAAAAIDLHTYVRRRGGRWPASE